MEELMEHLEDVKDVGETMGLPPKGCAVIKSVIETVRRTIKDEYLDKASKERDLEFQRGYKIGINSK